MTSSREGTGSTTATQRLDLALGWVGRLLWHLKLDGLIRFLSRSRPKVLLYHACEPEEHDGIKGLEINCPPEVFAAQLDHLARHYEVVSLGEIESGDARPGAVLVTFDDGYLSVLEHAAPLLAARDMPAVMYLITDVVGNDDAVWVNELNWLLVNHPGPVGPLATAALGLPASSSASTVVAAAVGSYDASVVEGLLADAWAVVGDRSLMLDGLDLYLSWDEVRSMASSGFDFGSHTETHPDVTRISSDHLERELEGSISAIAGALGSCTSFAFPFGFADDSTIATVERLPLASVMLVGNVHPTDPPRRLTRVSLTSASDAQIFAEIEVIDPAKRLIRSVMRRLRR